MIAPLLAAAIVIALVVYVVVASDGGYFGPRFVRFLYQRMARWWDYPTTDDARRRDSDVLLPLLERHLTARPDARGLDVACGTGRLPLLLLRDAPWFTGTIDGVDLSPNMLARAQRALDELADGARVTLTEGNATRLPWQDDTFDVVTCIEAFHNFGRPREALREMVRVLTPGGALFVHKASDRRARGLPYRALTRRQFSRLLAEQGMADVRFHPYHSDEGGEIVEAKRRG